MTREDLTRLLAPFGQEHLLRFWDHLSEERRTALASQISALDLPLVRSLAERITESDTGRLPAGLRPPETVPVPSSQQEHEEYRRACEVGLDVLRRRECAVMLVAGGQATRLGYDAPKGMFPIAPVTGKTLFQTHAEKILALSRKIDVPLRWLIMTSPANDAETRRYFSEHDFFELDPSCVSFFVQGTLPAVDPDGKILLAGKDSLALSPDGHGGSLLALRKSGLLNELAHSGVEVLFYFQVDNPLVSIADPAFLGYHAMRSAEISFKVVEKTDPGEKVGVVAASDQGFRVIEYSDLPEGLAQRRDPDERLTFRAGSVGIHLLNVDFVRRLLDSDTALPYHVAHKKVTCVDDDGRVVQPDCPNAFKFEKFIFDALAAAHRAMFMEVRRESEFAPVKNADGPDSPETARALLHDEWARWLLHARLVRSADELRARPVEISPLYALDADEFARKTPALPDTLTLLFEPSPS